MNGSAGRIPAVVVGGLLCSAALGLLAVAGRMPAHYLGSLGIEADSTAVIRSFQTNWLLATAVLAGLYVSGLALLGFRRGGPPSHEPRPGLLPTAIAALLLLAAAFWFFVGAALGRLVPAYFTALVTLWAIVLVAYVWTSLWGRLLRPLGMALTLAGVLAAAWVIHAFPALEQGTSPGLAYPWLLELFRQSGGGGMGSTRGEIRFLSTTVIISPVASSIFLVLGLPLLILPRRRPAFTASLPALGVGVLLLISSVLLPRTLRVAGALQSALPPGLGLSGSALEEGLSSNPMPVPPPPPPPRAPRP
jgi:hypothetical protein